MKPGKTQVNSSGDRQRSGTLPSGVPYRSTSEKIGQSKSKTSVAFVKPNKSVVKKTHTSGPYSSVNKSIVKRGETPGGRDYKITKSGKVKNTIVTDRPGTFSDKTHFGVSNERHYEKHTNAYGSKKMSVNTKFGNALRPETKTERSRTVSKGPTQPIKKEWSSGKRIESKKK